MNVEQQFTSTKHCNVPFHRGTWLEKIIQYKFIDVQIEYIYFV